MYPLQKQHVVAIMGNTWVCRWSAFFIMTFPGDIGEFLELLFKLVPPPGLVCQVRGDLVEVRPISVRSSARPGALRAVARKPSG